MTKETSVPISDKEETSKESERKWSVKTIQVRSNSTQDALLVSNSNEILYQNLVFAVLIPTSSLLLSTGITIVPQHNVFEHPGYWYEIAIPNITCILPTFVLLTILRMKVLFPEVNFEVSTWIKFYLINSINACLSIFISHFVWTDYLGYAFPVPFLYVLIPTLMFPILLPSFVLTFPRDYREELNMRTKIKWFMVYILWFFSACYQRIFVIYSFLSTPLQVQPIWAILLPLWRNLDHWIQAKLLKKIAGENNRDAKIFTCVENQCNHAALMAITLGLYATDFSCYCILISKLLLKLYSCYGIGQLNKKIETKEGLERKELLRTKEATTQRLILDEAVEVMMPIVYALMILLAYYGPNSAILGNVGCEIWKWRKITNLTKFLIALFRMFAIDLLALVLNSFLLWKYSSVHVMKQLCIDVKTYWPFISVTMGGSVTKVLNYIVS